MATTSSSCTAVSGSSSVIGPETLRRNRVLSSKLYFDVPLTKVPVIYSSSYDIAFFGIEKLHPFDSSKWGRICQFLIKDGVLDKTRIVEPLEASKDDLLV
ncbi:Histone deacetylase superfamily [Macleaya cordata]|uniref:Histone deacetylase superfamily n=1 Tax=Macleaya cordata TaxID=56857 RepID=A0A200QD96_MACCD|nr:Histone deacetylase superfamily [Macleaya cordata]